MTRYLWLLVPFAAPILIVIALAAALARVDELSGDMADE